ncbi:hypothetical protein P6U16_17105 [Rhizobium sp. 32-5/1]|uniref:hypothetical protein n=1 Tax=Rhizobium sp. 32-5/1 TaxID=3019602 RepID=UPI00240CEAAD|nr:hypothetical protein [Rhizobium sp. 32-5/1]WEZ85263.1 hypothetical protein P6U16_17105 [Rhizobium sp. 32-5/1]
MQTSKAGRLSTYGKAFLLILKPEAALRWFAVEAMFSSDPFVIEETTQEHSAVCPRSSDGFQVVFKPGTLCSEGRAGDTRHLKRRVSSSVSVSRDRLP